MVRSNGAERVAERPPEAREVPENTGESGPVALLVSHSPQAITLLAAVGRLSPACGFVRREGNVDAPLNMRLRLGTITAIALSLVACSGAGKYVWVNDLPAVSASPDEYRIRAGDLVSIIVFQQDAMSARARVRSDGKLAFPILGDIVVRGLRPADVKGQLEARLKEYVLTPHVTVSIEETQPIEVSVLGEVARPGIFTLKANATLAQALASAGGMTDFANRDRVFVIRPPKRIRFTYEGIVRGEGRSATFVLEPGDLIVVE